jgi:hypothetical protein
MSTFSVALRTRCEAGAKGPTGRRKTHERVN